MFNQASRKWDRLLINGGFTHNTVLKSMLWVVTLLVLPLIAGITSGTRKERLFIIKESLLQNGEVKLQGRPLKP